MTVLVAILCAVQEGRCFYCGIVFSGPPRSSVSKRRDDQWSRDHVLPLSKGGKLYVLACLKCNGAKGCRLPTPEEMRRAVLLRDHVDQIGQAMQGIGWTTIKAEKEAAREKIAASHVKGYRFPREEAHTTPFAVLAA